MLNNSCNLILLIVLVFPLFTFAQSAVDVKTPRNFASIKLGVDDPWVGIAYERVWIKYIGTEIQMGLIGASAGVKVYFPGIKSKRVNLYLGALHGWGFAGGLKTYFPIGINVLSKNNLRLSLDAGPRIWHDEGEDNILGASLKIGKGF